MEVVFDVRAFGDFEAHLGEDRDHLIHDLKRRVDAALGARHGGKREVDALLFQTLCQMRRFQVGLLRVERALNGIADGVDGRAGGLALFRRQGAERLEQARDTPGLAQRRDAHGVQCSQV